MTNRERLTVLDELFLHLEGPNTHMHVGGITIFEGPAPPHDEVMDMVQRRLPAVPRFRRKLATVPFGAGRPVWVDDAHFNLEYHVRHTGLPRPGDPKQLKRLVGRIMSQQLDRNKPLWEIWVVEGLTDDRFALVSKTHHCMIDGVSGADIMTVMMDMGPEPYVPGHEPWVPETEPSPDRLLIDAIKDQVTSPAEVLRTLQSAVTDPGRITGQAVEAIRALGAFVGGSLDLAPTSSLNQSVGPHRRFESVAAELAEFKAVKNTLGGTVNDVVLAVVTGGVRTLLLDRGERVDDVELRAMVPVSVRADAERGALGNRVSSMWAGLPLHEADPVNRLHLISERMDKLKVSGQAVGAQILTRLGEYAPPTILAQAARLVARQRAFNLVITNVPGPQFPLYTMGRKMLEVYPVLPLSGNTTLGVALFSYNGTIGFGLLGDYDTTPDLGVLAEGIEKAISELVAAAA